MKNINAEKEQQNLPLDVYSLRDNENKKLLLCRMKCYALRYKQTIDHVIYVLECVTYKREYKKAQLRVGVYIS